MKLWLVLSFPGLHLGPAPAPPPADRWTGRDKLWHVVASATVQGAAYAAFRTGRTRYPDAIVKASLVTATVGVGKELYDRRHPARHDASWRDLAADAVGGAGATVVIRQLDR